jgi:hypothetical protein
MLRRLAWFAGGMAAGHLLTLHFSDVDIRDAWASKVSHYRTELMRRMQTDSVQSAEQALMQANQKVLSSQIQLDVTRQEKKRCQRELSLHLGPEPTGIAESEDPGTILHALRRFRQPHNHRLPRKVKCIGCVWTLDC